MEVYTEYQPNFNGKQRDVIWITAENFNELRLLEKLVKSLHPSPNIVIGMTGADKERLTIEIYENS